MEYVEISAKTVEDAVTEALLRFETTSDNIEYEVVDKGSSGFLGIIGNKPAVIRVRKKFSLPDYTSDFLDRLFKAMELEVKSTINYDEENKTMDISFDGEDMGLLIGKRGQTLDSLQYIISLVVNKESDSYIRVKADTENYRERRKETLENLAKNLAYKVKRTRHSVTLEPMNPYERRIIHSALQGDRYVETHSEGDEPYRRVVITLKKEYRDKGQNHKYDRNTNNYHKKYNRRSDKDDSEKYNDAETAAEAEDVVEDIEDVSMTAESDATEE